MRLLLNAFYDVPDLIRSLFTGKYALVAVLITIVYLVSIFLNNKVTRLIREGLVIVAVAAGIIAYFKRKFPFFWLMLILLVILFVVRFLSYMLVTIRIRRKNRKIERRALEKAAQRRGSWDEKRGFSGKPEPVEKQISMPAMDKREIADVLENETSEREGADIDLTEEKAAPAAGDAGKHPAPSEEELARPVVMDALRKLNDLKEIGILTEEEVNEKRALLYSRMR